MEAVGAKPVTICQICDKAPSKYLCPRCGIPYCSLTCYKNEGKHLQCSESFYRDCVLEKMKEEEQQDPESARKMKQVLQRFHEQYNVDNEGHGPDGEEGVDGMEEGEEELDSDDDEPLDKRLAGVDLNDAEAVWRHLTEEERREFQHIAKNVDVAGDIIPEWIPWWEDEPERKLVVEVLSDDDKTTNNLEESSSTPLSCPKLHKRQPDILNPIPVMSELTKIKPNQHVAKGMINVVAAYTWAARLFNGDLFDPAKVVEVASSIIYLSSFLKKDGLFKNIEHAVADVPLNACQVPDLSEGGTSIQAELNRDVWIIIKGPKISPRGHPPSSASLSTKSYLLSALTECYTVILKAAKLIKGHKKGKSEQKTDKSSEEGGDDGDSFSKVFPSPPPVLSVDSLLVTRAKRKCLYLIAFANEYMESMDLLET